MFFKLNFLEDNSEKAYMKTTILILSMLFSLVACQPKEEGASAALSLVEPTAPAAIVIDPRLSRNTQGQKIVWAGHNPVTNIEHGFYITSPGYAEYNEKYRNGSVITNPSSWVMIEPVTATRFESTRSGVTRVFEYEFTATGMTLCEGSTCVNMNSSLYL